MIRRCRSGTAAATACAIGVLGALSLAPAAMAGKPTPPPPSTVATAYSGEAQVVEADVEVLGLINLLEAHISSAPLWLDANVASAHTAGAGDRSHSSASVANVNLGVGVFSPSLLRVQASVVRSSALAKCGANGAHRPVGPRQPPDRGR